VDGLVLTEWKKVPTPGEAPAYANGARAQAAAYGEGLLAACELASVRYLVLVSETECSAIDDVFEGGFWYRHINIVVKPSTPSALARG
jgi:hypothetical protein